MNTSRRNFLVAAGVTSTGLLFGLPTQAEAAAPVTETRPMLGTFVSITLADVSPMQAEDALGNVFSLVEEQERLFSRYKADSPIAILNQQGSLDMPPEGIALLERALRYGDLTNGAFDITVQPVVDLFRAHTNPKGKMRLDPAALQAAQELVGRDGVQMRDRRVQLKRQGMGITLDGIAKGHIADKASQALLACGINNHLVNAGGDIIAQGMKGAGMPWRVAIDSPYPSKQGYATVVALSNKAIATSGSSECYYDVAREHHHLINPASGRSPAIGSVSVMAPTVLEADALATALSVMPPQEALRMVQALPQRECCLFTSDGRRFASRGWSEHTVSL